MANAKGLYSTWDRLGNLSASIVLMQNIKKQVNSSLGTYRSNTHTEPDTSDISWKVGDTFRDLTLDRTNLMREGNRFAKAKTNCCEKGEEQLISSTLGTFSKKVRRNYEGFDDHHDELDVDEISPNQITLGSDDVAAQ